MIPIGPVDQEALAPIANGLSDMPEVWSAFAYGYGIPSAQKQYAVATYLHDNVWDSRANFAHALTALAAVGRRAINMGLPAPNLFHFFPGSNHASHPAGVAWTLRAEAVPLAGAPIHRSLGWLKASEATRFHAPISAIRRWRSLAWTYGRELFLRPEKLDRMASQCFDMATIACGASGAWAPRDQTVPLLKRLQPSLTPVLDESYLAYHKWIADPRPETAQTLGTSLLLFMADLADVVVPMIRTPLAESPTLARRSAAKSPAPIMTAEAEETALRVRNKLRSALLALLAVRTPFDPLILVAVLDDLMPTPAIRLLQLASPGAAARTPVIFFRQAELPLLAVAARSEQYLFGTHLYPYLATALIGGSRLLHGEELRPTLRAPDRAVSVLSTISDLQLHLRPHLMLKAAVTGSIAAHRDRAAREMDHLLALGLWLHELDNIDPEHLQDAFFRAYPDFPYRDEVMHADFARDHIGWCWAWEITASWLRSKAEHALPGSLRGVVLPVERK